MNENGAKEARNSVFVIMPFDEDFDDVYLIIRDATNAVSSSLGIAIECLRADEIAEPGRITDQILKSILDADLLIADISGPNPNVMYELGFGHALSKQAIILNQDVHSSPFDVKGFRQILYDRNRLMKECRPSLVTSITDVFGSKQSQAEPGAQEGVTDEGAGDPTPAQDRPLRPGNRLVAKLQMLHLRMQHASAKGSTTEVRAAANEVRDLLSRVTVATGADKGDMNNTAAVAGNCAVEMEKADLLDHASTVYRRALGLFPDYAGLHLQYCDFLMDADKFDEAKQELARVRTLERDEQDERRLKVLEVKLSMKTGGDSAEVRANLGEAFEKHPGDRFAAAGYLMYLDRSGAPLSEFEEACAKWKEAAPEGLKWEADRALADHLAGRGSEHTERSVQIYEKLLESKGQPDDDRAAMLHNVAQLYLRLDQTERGKAAWMEAYRLSPGDPAIRAVFSQWLATTGEIDTALAVAQGDPLPDAAG